ncbi:uncharacterized protein BYT42DRAFT_194349 [Radiomyces spectabilis]|uniref:uncharacterized protein n=1 Tax=Radiomyces spectabilis TaxID=64574 RepID=UPI00221FD586|nr:uncharacterized protein BYT42DRAFT_194349 [Radiomyces spectabilis]KAI8391435.1 hypothetical protein BYT42DRAFT_194349 [Radiomyces spectabilis]
MPSLDITSTCLLLLFLCWFGIALAQPMTASSPDIKILDDVSETLSCSLSCSETRTSTTTSSTFTSASTTLVSYSSSSTSLITGLTSMTTSVKATKTMTKTKTATATVMPAVSTLRTIKVEEEEEEEEVSFHEARLVRPQPHEKDPWPALARPLTTTKPAPIHLNHGFDPSSSSHSSDSGSTHQEEEDETMVGPDQPSEQSTQRDEMSPSEGLSTVHTALLSVGAVLIVGGVAAGILVYKIQHRARQANEAFSLDLKRQDLGGKPTTLGGGHGGGRAMSMIQLPLPRFDSTEFHCGLEDYIVTENEEAYIKEGIDDIENNRIAISGALKKFMDHPLPLPQRQPEQPAPPPRPRIPLDRGGGRERPPHNRRTIHGTSGVQVAIELPSDQFVPLQGSDMKLASRQEILSDPVRRRGFDELAFWEAQKNKRPKPSSPP